MLVRGKGGGLLTPKTKGGAALFARTFGAPPLMAYPTETSVGLAGVGLTVADLDDNAGAGWRGWDFYGFVDGAIYTGYDVWAFASITQFPVSDAGKTITFRNSRFYAGPDGDSWAFQNIANENGVQLVIEDSDIIGGSAEALMGSNYTLRRCRIHGSGDGLKFSNNIEIDTCFVDAWIDPAIPDAHSDGAQSLGSNGVLIKDSTFWMPNNATAAIMLSTGSASEMTNILVQRNLFRGGIYSVYAGYQAGEDDVAKITNVQFLDNAFSTTGDSLAPMTSNDPPVVHTGNKWYDGPSAGVVFD